MYVQLRFVVVMMNCLWIWDVFAFDYVFLSLCVSRSHSLSKDEILVLNSYVCSTEVCSCCDELLMD
jgi:hypothetical protein